MDSKSNFVKYGVTQTTRPTLRHVSFHSTIRRAQLKRGEIQSESIFEPYYSSSCCIRRSRGSAAHSFISKLRAPTDGSGRLHRIKLWRHDQWQLVVSPSAIAEPTVQFWNYLLGRSQRNQHCGECKPHLYHHGKWNAAHGLQGDHLRN